MLTGGGVFLPLKNPAHHPGRIFYVPLESTISRQHTYNSTMQTVYTLVPSRGHEYPDHPERAGRLDILEPHLKSFAAEKLEAARAASEQVALVHEVSLIKSIEAMCKQGPAIIDYAPTFITQTSFEDAMLAAGGVIACTRAVLRGEARNAFAIVRPPGHHAEPQRAMGFCILGASLELRGGRAWRA